MVHTQSATQGAKRHADVVGDVNHVVGNNTNSFLLHVTDTRRDEQWLVDGGALLSIVPPTPQQRRRGPSGGQLRAANGTEIKCFGSINRTITIGGNDFSFDFVVADVKNRILGADFLASFYLAPNHRDALLINLQDFSTIPATHARGISNSPVNFVSHAEDPFFTLLDKYPEIQTPTFTIQDPNTVCAITYRPTRRRFNQEPGDSIRRNSPLRRPNSRSWSNWASPTEAKVSGAPRCW